MKREGIFVEGFSDEAIAGLVTALRVAGVGRGGGRRTRFEGDVARRCFDMWTETRNRSVVRRNAKHKVTYGDVFAYCHEKLANLGIKSEKEFVAAIGAYSDRLSRRRRK